MIDADLGPSGYHEATQKDRQRAVKMMMETRMVWRRQLVSRKRADIADREATRAKLEVLQGHIDRVTADYTANREAFK